MTQIEHEFCIWLQVLGLQQAPCGVCGNGVCELGERCDASSTSSGGSGGLCCGQDCQYSLSSCPSAPGSTVPCSGAGLCLPGSGVCACFVGYLGDACDYPLYARAGSASEATPATSAGADEPGLSGCSPPSTWPQVVGWMAAGGRRVHSGGLGLAATGNFKVWVCLDPALLSCTGAAYTSSSTSGLACFRFDEQQLVFVWWGWNGDLLLVQV